MNKKTTEEKIDKLDTRIRILELDTGEELEKIYEGMTIRERVAKLENRLDKLDKVKWIPVINLPEEAKETKETDTKDCFINHEERRRY